MRESLLLQAFHEHEWELVRFLGRRLGSTSLAADIAHDLYLKLLRSEEATGVADGKAYLFGMAANLATDHLRVERRRGEILSEVADGLGWQGADELSPERHLLARAELDYIEAAVAALPERCRRIFRMNRYEGKSQAEIASALGVGLTTVYKDLKVTLDTMVKARRRFRSEQPNESRQRKR